MASEKLSSQSRASCCRSSVTRSKMAWSLIGPSKSQSKKINVLLDNHHRRKLFAPVNLVDILEEVCKHGQLMRCQTPHAKPVQKRGDAPV